MDQINVPMKNYIKYIINEAVKKDRIYGTNGNMKEETKHAAKDECKYRCKQKSSLKRHKNTSINIVLCVLKISKLT